MLIDSVPNSTVLLRISCFMFRHECHPTFAKSRKSGLVWGSTISGEVQEMSSNNQRRYWGMVTPGPAAMIEMLAKNAESQGYEGVMTAQVWGPPFATLAVAAAHTERIKIASGIAIAAARSPFETAVAAIDLDRISNGRFILGLGASIESITTGFFGSPRIKPVSHLRETIEAVRHIIAGGHKGLAPFEGGVLQG